MHQLPHILSSEASHGDSSECPGNLDITQVDVVNTGTYADPRSPNWETQRKKSRGRRDYNLGQYCPQRCHLLAARLETLVRSGHFGANPVGSKPQQRGDTHLGHISETEAVPEERTESEGKRNNISGSERLSLMTRTSPASETEAPSGGEDGSITNGDEGDAEGKRNNISGSERLSLMTRTSPASEMEAVARDYRHKVDSGAPKRATRTSKTKTVSGDDSSGNAAVAQEPTARRSSRIANSRSRVADTAE